MQQVNTGRSPSLPLLLVAWASCLPTHTPSMPPVSAAPTRDGLLTRPTLSIALFAATPPSMAGITGAIFYCALHLGVSVGIAVMTSIQAAVDRKAHSKVQTYDGLRAAFWFLFAVAAVLLVATLVFYRTEGGAVEIQHTEDADERHSSNKEKPEADGRASVRGASDVEGAAA